MHIGLLPHHMPVKQVVCAQLKMFQLVFALIIAATKGATVLAATTDATSLAAFVFIFRIVVSKLSYQTSPLIIHANLHIGANTAFNALSRVFYL